MYDPSIFRQYDIRGVAGTQLTEDVAYGVGRALGTRIVRSGGTTAAVGRDVRHSSPALAAAVARGFATCGLQVFDLAQVPTPVLYHFLHRERVGGGIMVTGSHNPKSDNGLKLCLGSASLYGEDVATLRTQAEAEDFVDGDGRVEAADYVPIYLDDVCSRFKFPEGLHVAIDCGNGVMGPIVLEAVKRLRISVEPLYCEPDGDFPNHIPDPEVPAYMETWAGGSVTPMRCAASGSMEMGIGWASSIRRGARSRRTGCWPYLPAMSCACTRAARCATM